MPADRAAWNGRTLRNFKVAKRAGMSPGPSLEPVDPNHHVGDEAGDLLDAIRRGLNRAEPTDGELRRQLLSHEGTQVLEVLVRGLHLLGSVIFSLARMLGSRFVCV